MMTTRQSEQPDASLITRREALRRAALLAGVAFSPELLTFVGRAQTPADRLQYAREIIQGEAAALQLVAMRLDRPFLDAVELLVRHDSPAQGSLHPSCGDPACGHQLETCPRCGRAGRRVR